MIGWITAIFVIIQMIILMLVSIEVFPLIGFIPQTKWKAYIIISLISIVGATITGIIWGYGISRELTTLSTKVMA
jgi:hypothetical protein